jgi:4-amino-4-deoxy-L-arabinose transferase-like glycosyltransferase
MPVQTIEQYRTKDLLPYWIWLAIAYLAGLIAVDIMDVDAAQYASISMEMLQTGNWLEVYHKGADYLDKPPLVFWLSAFFYQLFGINSISFKLPSLLSSILGFWSTYKLGEALYNRKTGQLAALMLASTQAWFLFNHDIRTDTLLTNFCIFAIWQLYSYLQNHKALHFMLGFVGVGLAMLSKGPIGLVVPATAIGGYLLFKGDWKSIFDWRWLLAPFIILLVLSPMLYGLWTQYGSEGIYFYFWKQSFGRITGENSWKDDTGAFYFVHTFLWSFLPWTLFALIAFGKRIAALWKGNFKLEWLTFAGFIFPFIALSFSHFKLPHYIFPVYPMMVILSAHSLLELKGNWYKLALGFQYFLMGLMLVASIAMLYFVFPSASFWIWILLLIGFSGSIFMLLKRKEQAIWGATLLAFSSLNLILNLHFYPNLLQYQSGSQVAAYIHQQQIPVDLVGAYGMYQHSLDFNLGKIAKVYEDPGQIIQDASAKVVWLYCDEEAKKYLESQGVMIKEEIEFQHFHVTKLNLKFLNPEQREEQLKKVYLLKLEGVLS